MDFEDILTETPKESERSAFIKRQLEKRSRDEIAVYNPTNEDYTEVWGGIIYRFPAKKETSVERYVAEKYIENMTNKMMFDEVQFKVDKENERRTKVNQSPMNKWEEQPRFEAQLGILFNPEKKVEIWKSLYRGVTRKFGQEDIFTDKKTADDKRQTDISKFIADLERTPEAPVDESLETRKKNMISEVSQ